MVSGAASKLAKRLPLFRPTFDRRIPHRLAEEVLRSRLLPLIGEIAKRKIELRTERVKGLPEQLQDLLDATTHALGGVEDPEALHDRVNDVTHRLERVLTDVDYVTFGQVGLVSQLRALAVTLRTSRLLWTAVRGGYAFRDPALQKHGLRVLGQAESVLGRAGQGLDVAADLDALETDYLSLVTAVEAEAGPLGLPDERSFLILRRTWSYRTRAEAEILARDGREGPLTNRELFEDVRKNGLPPKLVEEEIDQHVLPALRRLTEQLEAERGGLPERIALRAKKLETELIAIRDEPLSTDELEARVVAAQRELSELLAEAERLVNPAHLLLRRMRMANDAMLGLRSLFVALRVIDAAEDPELRTQLKNLGRTASEVLSGDLPRAALPGALLDLQLQFDHLDRELRHRLHIDRTPALDQLSKAVATMRRLVNVRIAAEAALNPEMQEAMAAAQDLGLRPEVRAPIFDAAMKEPLLDSTIGLAVALREAGSRVRLPRRRRGAGAHAAERSGR